MGLFSFFRNQNANPQPQNQPTNEIEIPKEVFIEERDPSDQSIPTNNGNGILKDIKYVYAYLQADYEGKGYGDAIVNQDEVSKKDNIELLKKRLQIIIQEVKSNYDDELSELNTHIESRGRAGLVDLVEELKTKKSRVNEKLIDLDQIKKDSENSNGLFATVILSYQKGFNRGLTALSQSRFNKN